MLRADVLYLVECQKENIEANALKIIRHPYSLSLQVPLKGNYLMHKIKIKWGKTFLYKSTRNDFTLGRDNKLEIH